VAADPTAPPLRRRGERGGGRARRRRGGLGAFLVASALPLAAIAAYALLPEATRADLRARVPEGAGGRALLAGGAFAAMALLAWVALPAFHGASAAVAGLRDRIRSRGPVVRVLLFPFEALLALGWLSLQVLFAIDAFLIVATGLAGLLLAVRIVAPEALPDLLPGLRR